MMNGSKYAGLGASLGVPQSALESVTSLDPKDYIYPSFGSIGSSESIEEQLAGRGAEESMRVFSFEQRAQNLRQSYSSIFTGFGRSNSFSQVCPVDVLADLDPESLDYLKLNEYDMKAISEEYSEKSSNTTATRISPRRNTCGSTRRSRKSVLQEEEDDDLLVSGGSNFHGLDTEILGSKSSNIMALSGKRGRKLSLSLDHEATAACINSVLDSDKVTHALEGTKQSKKQRLKTGGANPSDSCESSPCNVNFASLEETNAILG
jgi:hypothetical protein